MSVRLRDSCCSVLPLQLAEGRALQQRQHEHCQCLAHYRRPPGADKGSWPSAQHTCSVVQSSKLAEVAGAVEHLGCVQGADRTRQQDFTCLHNRDLDRDPSKHT